jgi:surface carbohydrate biosynthesis protein
MKKRVYIHCEITKREFEGKLLLSTIAADKNFDVYMGNIQGLESNINIPTGLLHFTSCTPSKKILSLFKRLKKKNFIISCQDEEGGVEEVKNFFSKLPVGMFHYRFSESSLKLIDALFSWSTFDYNHLISRFPKYKKKIFNTGNPRADMWSKILNLYMPIT